MEFLDVLTELGRRGGIGPVRPLAGLADVVAAFGEPPRSGPLDDEQPWPRWSMYGDLSLETCRCDVVNRVGLRTWYESVSVPVGESGRLLDFDPATGFPALRAAFAGAGIGWREIQRLDDQFTLQTEPADVPDVTVSFTITTREDPDGVLYSVHATEHVHLC